MVGFRAIKAVLIGFKGEPWSLPASLILHALLLLGLSSVLAPRIRPPLAESIPVEIWTPEDWAIVGASPSKSIRIGNEDAAAAAQPAAPVPRTAGPIRATTMLAATILTHPQSHAMRAALGRMEEETRLEQLCGIETMAQIAEHIPTFKPERIVAYARAEVKLIRNILFADGAAFRSGQTWHEVKFTCELDAERQNVRALEFAVGRAIPNRDWERYSLPSPALDTD